MGKRKGEEEIQETLISTDENDGVNEREEDEDEGKAGGGGGGGGKRGRFFACYLLTSLCPRFKGHTYIGFTVNPRRRIRQHNGEIGSGAWRTKRKRPWEMVLCIYGFPTNVAALQFEWAWQHPVESLAVRKAAASFKSLSGLANKIKLAHTMLTLPAWQSLNLTVNFFSTKYQQHVSGCPPLPEQMRTQVSSMDDLPCYSGNAVMNDDCDSDGECDIINYASHEPTKEYSRELDEHGNHGVPLPFEENVHNPVNKEDGVVNLENIIESPLYLPLFYPQTREENLGHQSLVLNDSPVKLSSSLDSSCVVESVNYSSGIRVEDFGMSRVQPLEEQPIETNSVVHKDQIFSTSNRGSVSGDVEIIDLFTPSPRQKNMSRSKKRRPTMSCEIIDLTKSPVFV